MSYDIQFGVKVEGTDIIATIGMPEYSDPTYKWLKQEVDE